MPASDEQKPAEPIPAVEVPAVVLPSDVERLLAQVVPASTPAPPSYAEGLYEYEDALKAVSLTEEASEEPQSAEEFAPVEMDESNAGNSIKEDASMNAAPSVAPVQQAETLSAKQSKAVKKISDETQALGKANRKKSRNPEVLKLSQSKKLKSLLRSE
jgi:hypothetical protein